MPQPFAPKKPKKIKPTKIKVKSYLKAKGHPPGGIDAKDWTEGEPRYISYCEVHGVDRDTLRAAGV